MNNETNICPICNGSKYILDHTSNTYKKCKCLWQQELKSFLPTLFKGKDYGLKKDYKHSTDKYLMTINGLKAFGRFINSYLTHRYMHNPKITYHIATTSFIIEQFYSQDSSVLYNSDILIIMLYGGYPHKSTEQFLSAVIKDRQLTQKDTIFFIDANEYTFQDPKTKKTTLNISKVQERIGKSTYDLITSFTTI